MTQLNIRHSCRTAPLSADNLTIGQAFGRVAKSGKSKQSLVFGPNQVDQKQKCRWTERSDLSVAILSCKQPQGRVLKTGRRNRVEEWEDSIGTKWIRAQSGDGVGAAAESEDAFNPNERVHWHDEYGKPYDGPRNYRGLPEPKCAGGASHAGRGIEPWQWQKPKSKMGVIVDPHGKIAQDLSDFLAGLELGQAQNWEEEVQQSVIALLAAADEAIKGSGAFFRGEEINDSDAIEIAVLPQGLALRELALCIGIDQYHKGEYQDRSLKNCVNDAKAIASEFSFGKRESSTAVVCENVATNVEWRTLLEKRFCPHIERAGPELCVVSVFVACHGVQVKNELFLVPSDEAIVDERTVSPKIYKQSIKDNCVSLSELVASVIEAVAKRQEPKGKVVCAFICDVCRGLSLAEGAESLHIACEKHLEDEDIEVPSWCHLVLMFSASQDEAASDGSGNHSPFTQAFLDSINTGLNDVTQSLTLQDIFCRANDEVLNVTAGNQEPDMHGNSSVPLFVRSAVDAETEAPRSPLPQTHSNVRCYDIYFAAQPVPNAVHIACRGDNCLEHQACKQNLLSCFKHQYQMTESNSKAKHKICLSDGHEEALLDHFAILVLDV